MALGVGAALVAALCWTLASGLWRRLPTSLGPARLNLLKSLLALVPLAPWLPWARAAAAPLPAAATALLLASGVVGIALGDSLYFAALRRLGTRRTLTLDAGAPAVTALVGLALLREAPEPRQWLGLLAVTLALLLVARQAPPGQLTPGWQGSRAQLRLGVVLALGALLCGSAGALLARAAFVTTAVLPLQAAALRLAGANLVLLPLLPGLVAWGRRASGPRPASRRWPLVLLATLLGTTVAIGLQQLALSRLQAGVAVALLATAPVMALLLAPLEQDRPGVGGWLAGLLVLAGVALLLA